MVRVKFMSAICASVFLFAFAAIADDVSQQQPPRPASPVSPEQSLEYFHLAPGLRMEVAACEPQVIDPVAIRFDEDGRMWVVEMRDYPHGPGAGEEPRSQIRILEDRDGDGRFETSQVFADKLLFVTGLQPWQGGAIVTLAGKVAYMKDTNGDGRADRVETWYTGFMQENSQLRANHPRFGLDNHIYVANGLRGGTIVDARQKDSQPLSISGMDFRFDPFTGKYEAVTGVGQFGLTFDDFGNRFVCSNRNPLKHIVLEDRYLKRNPLAAVPAAAHDVAKWGEESHIFPISRAWTTSTLHAGQFTAACGVHIYRGDALPAEFKGNGFTCDPTGNLVHREIMAAAGATFDSRPAREGIEFLASTDEWFRPVNMEVGPDGALYVVDMYRAVIEHPQFMPEELKKRPDLRYGDDRGRIYRIVAKDAKSRIAPPKLSAATSEQLVAELEHPNSWRRETAARLIVQRQDRSAVKLLAQTAAVSKIATARVHALWALKGLDSLTEPVVSAALRDADPRVREQAIVLSETWLTQSKSLREQVVALADDADSRVRFQVALSLAPITDATEVDALRRIALAGADDPWTRRAVAIAAGSHAAELAAAILNGSDWSRQGPSDSQVVLIGELAAVAGSSQNASDHARLLVALAALPSGPSTQRVQMAALQSLSQSLSRQRLSLDATTKRLGDESAKQKLAAVFERAGRVAADGKAAETARMAAIDLLAYRSDAESQLASLALQEPVQTVRVRAIAALSQQTSVESWRQLLAKFPGETPAVRRAILDAVLSRNERTSLLLDSIEAGRIKAAELDRAQTNRLTQHRDAEIRERATRLLADAIPADRRQVLADYQPVLAWKADARRGLEVFTKNCATCHRIGDVGVNVAPDIADSRTKTPEQLLMDILQPNRAIDSNYVSYSVITTDGRTLTGILVSETGSSITLKQPEGKSVTLLRSEIDELRSNGISLMPEGLEKNVPPQDMADLISFIKNWRYLDGRTPLSDAAK
jgi:putative membrane-bound dehydrogenase-like protein